MKRITSQKKDKKHLAAGVAEQEARLRTLIGIGEKGRLPMMLQVVSIEGLTANSCTVCCPSGSQAQDVLIVKCLNGERFQIKIPENLKEDAKFEVNLNSYEAIYGFRDLPKPAESNIITDLEEVGKPQYRRKPTRLVRPSWGLEQLKVARSLSADEANCMVCAISPPSVRYLQLRC